jgi:hypothetical protein
MVPEREEGQMTQKLQGLMDHFDRFLGDGCSALVLAIAAALLSGYLRQLVPTDEGRIRCRSSLVGVFAFLGFCAAEYLRRGPEWITIVFVSALRAWLLASVLGIALASWALLRGHLLDPVLLRLRIERDQRARQKYVDTIRRDAPVSPPVPPPPHPPPPLTVEQKAAQLLEKFNRLERAIAALPIPANEKTARLNHLRKQLNRDLDRLTENELL